MLEALGIEKSYGTLKVLKGVDLTVGGTHGDNQIISDLLSAGKLITSA